MHRKDSIGTIKSENTSKNVEHTDFFPVSYLPPMTIHFFEKISVEKATMYSHYGNAPLGEPGNEVQRYTSNANFTINLLNLMQRINYTNVIL